MLLDENNEKTPIRFLVGVKRIRLKAGETKNAKFDFSSEKKVYIKENGEVEIRKGMVTVSVGGKQPCFNGIADASSTQVITKKNKDNQLNDVNLRIET